MDRDLIPAFVKRFEDCYEFLVDETEEYLTTYNKKRHDRLSDLLALFEYLRGEDPVNPLDDWFPPVPELK